MLLTMYTVLMTTATFSLCLASTPIILGLNILIMALLLSISFASFLSSWYAFLIFLIYVGGMLVMFAYFMALTPNQHVSKMNITMLMSLSLLMLFSLLLWMNATVPMMSNHIQGNSILFLYMNTMLLIILALVLLLTMVIVVKNTYRSKGPLRPFL